MQTILNERIPVLVTLSKFDHKVKNKRKLKVWQWRNRLRQQAKQMQVMSRQVPANLVTAKRKRQTRLTCPLIWLIHLRRCSRTPQTKIRITLTRRRWVIRRTQLYYSEWTLKCHSPEVSCLHATVPASWWRLWGDWLLISPSVRVIYLHSWKPIGQFRA